MSDLISSHTYERLRAATGPFPNPTIFITVSGAHLYRFPSADSDYDLRGVHVLPAREMLGLLAREDTREIARDERGLLLDLVTHDAAKFFGLLLKRNGYVLEQLFSPLIVQSTPAHAELKSLAHGCITRHHAHHYLGFGQTQWKLFEKSRTVKALLYTYRVLMTGIHLMRTGEIEADLRRLNADAGLKHVDELIQRKTSGGEKGTLGESEWAGHDREYARLVADLETESERSVLPEAPTARAAMSDLLVRLRLNPGRLLEIA